MAGASRGTVQSARRDHEHEGHLGVAEVVFEQPEHQRPRHCGHRPCAFLPRDSCARPEDTEQEEQPAEQCRQAALESEREGRRVKMRGRPRTPVARGQARWDIG